MNALVQLMEQDTFIKLSTNWYKLRSNSVLVIPGNKSIPEQVKEKHREGLYLS